MAKFEIFRADINKVVAKSIVCNSFEEALGKYASVLMVAGMIRMRDGAIEMLSATTARINTIAGKSFVVEARAI